MFLPGGDYSAGGVDGVLGASTLFFSNAVTTASFSVWMLLGTKGRQYTFGELRQMLASAGFDDIETRPTYGYYSVVSGRKA